MPLSNVLQFLWKLSQWSTIWTSDQSLAKFCKVGAQITIPNLDLVHSEPSYSIRFSVLEFNYMVWLELHLLSKLVLGWRACDTRPKNRSRIRQMGLDAVGVWPDIWWQSIDSCFSITEGEWNLNENVTRLRSEN